MSAKTPDNKPQPPASPEEPAATDDAAPDAPRSRIKGRMTLFPRRDDASRKNEE